MDSLKRYVILLRLARELKSQGNWCGETHMQKAVYLLQDLAGAETEFEYVLYKHGPFSFELRDQLTAMRADNLLDLEIQPQPYGPKLVPTEHAVQIESKFPKTLANNKNRIERIAGIVGDKGVSELERLATALFITRREMPEAPADLRAQRLNEIKPHISLASAMDAVEEIDTLIGAAQQ